MNIIRGPGVGEEQPKYNYTTNAQCKHKESDYRIPNPRKMKEVSDGVTMFFVI